MSDELLAAPCVFCGYNGVGYYQLDTHGHDCPWRNIAGPDRNAVLRKVVGDCFEQLRTQQASEAVATVKVWNKGGSGEFTTADGIEKPPDGTKLYTYQPAPVVPEYLDDMDKVPNSINMGQGWSASAAYAFGWNACREEMLKSAQGSEIDG